MALFGPHKPGQQQLPHLQAGHVIGITAKDDVCAAAGHVGGNGYGASPAGLGNDLRLPLHIFWLGI